MCAGWLSAMLTGTYDTFLESLGPDQCPGSVNKQHDHSQDYQEGLECTQLGEYWVPSGGFRLEGLTVSVCLPINWPQFLI